MMVPMPLACRESAAIGALPARSTIRVCISATFAATASANVCQMQKPYVINNTNFEANLVMIPYVLIE